jgi:hypothetical protein
MADVTQTFTVDALIQKSVTQTFTVDAVTVKQHTWTVDALVVDTRGSWRGEMTTADRNALVGLQAGDTVTTTDASGRAYHEYYTGSAWISASRTQAAAESGNKNYLTAPTTGGWRVEMGDATYPLRYWNGTLTNFTVDSAGAVTAKSILLLPQDTSTVAVTVQGAVAATDLMRIIASTGTRLFWIDSVGGAHAADSVSIRTAATDVYPTTRLDGGASIPQLAFGLGGATITDLMISRSAAGILALDNSLGTTGATLEFSNQTAPSSPASGAERLYGNAGKLKWKDSSGNIYDLSNVGTRTRTFTIPLTAMTPESGASATTLGSGTNAMDAVTLHDALSEGVMFSFSVPSDWASGALTYTTLWAPSATDAVSHTVRWTADVIELTAGTDVTAAGTTTGVTGTSAARTANLMVIGDTRTLLTPSVAGSFVRANLRRNGGHSNDTYVGDVNLLGIRLDYTSTA